MPYRSTKPLDDEVIDRLFSALLVRYGTPFLDRWRDLDLTVVKADWARDLAPFADNLGVMRFALDNLPDKPPTVIEFHRLCTAAPLPDMPRIESTGKPAPDRVIAALRVLSNRAAAKKDPRQWAYDLIAAHERGDRRPPACVEMARRVTDGRALPLGDWSAS